MRARSHCWSAGIGLCLLLAAGGHASEQPRASKRPNIIYMLVDDWGSYDASFRMRQLGREPQFETPNIDRLHHEGIGLSNYYVQLLCTPTRASLLSGRYSTRTGLYNTLIGNAEPVCLPTDLPILPQYFQELGYDTHMIGKWHLGMYNDSCAPWGRGFDSYMGYLTGSEGYTYHGTGAYLDFHECGPSYLHPNDTTSHRLLQTAQHARGKDSDVEAQGYIYYKTALAAGHDVLVGMFNLEDAKTWCSSNASCVGFTFEGPDKAPVDPVKVYFKSSLDMADDKTWNTYINVTDIPYDPGTPAGGPCSEYSGGGCAHEYEGEYSTQVYSRRLLQILDHYAHGAAPTRESGKVADRTPFFVYMPWQAVHEPMDAPEEYVARYQYIEDPSRRIYAGMLAVLDEAIGNITAYIEGDPELRDNTILVISNDNGGMSGTYGMGCCNCGTSCGGLNYPYRGWKSTYWEGGLRGIGAVWAPGFIRSRHDTNAFDTSTSLIYEPLMHVTDWLPTLISAALSRDSAEDRQEAHDRLRGLFERGAIDGIDQWQSLLENATTSAIPERGTYWNVESDSSTREIQRLRRASGPRQEVMHAYEPQHQHAAYTYQNYKLLLGNWGAFQHCDICNQTNGGVCCENIGGNPHHPQGPDWYNNFLLYDVVEDPRELNDLSLDQPDLLNEMMQRLFQYNETLVPDIHEAIDPQGNEHAAAVDCWSPWEGRVDEPLPMDLAFELDDDGMGVCVLETTDDEVVRTCTMDMIKKQEELHTPGIVSSGTDWNSVQAQ